MARFFNTFTQAYRDFTGDPPGYPWVAEDAMEPTAEGNTEMAAKTADAILAEVGTDATAAQAALDAENARDTPRTSLVAKLEKIAAQ